MHPQTYSPGLTAATTTARALIAAGWQYDSTSPMADDTTIRTLLHPSGREIHARTVDRDELTDLTLTGLTLEQVAGAITGAGLAEPATDAPQTREIKARYLKAGMTVIDGTDGPLVVTIVDRVADVVLVSFEGVPEWTQYAPEVGVTVVDGRPGEDAAQDPRQRLAAELHRIADDIVEHNLPVPTFSLRVGGCVESRADAQAWADFLGVEIKMGGSASNIPVAEKDIKLGDGQYLNLAFQAPSEERPTDPEKQRLLERVAELEARIAEGGADR